MQKGEYRDWFNGKQIVVPKEELAYNFKTWAFQQKNELLANPYHNLSSFKEYQEHIKKRKIEIEEEEEILLKFLQKKKQDLYETLRKNEKLNKEQFDLINHILDQNYKKFLQNIDKFMKKYEKIYNSEVQKFVKDLMGEEAFKQLSSRGDQNAAALFSNAIHSMKRNPQLFLKEIPENLKNSWGIQSVDDWKKFINNPENYQYNCSSNV